MSSSTRRRRLAMLVVAATVPPFLGLHLALGAPRSAVVTGLAWALALLVAGLLQREDRPYTSALGVLVFALAYGAGTATTIVVSGGSRSPFFGLLLALGPCFALIAPELPGVNLGVAALCTGAGVWIQRADGRDAADVALWAALALVVSALAMWAAVLSRRYGERQLELERERREALEALARAEVERLQLEQLAEAGRLAARVSHDVNSPLSAARSNLACLLAEGDIPPEERHAALQETVEAVQKIVDSVARLQAVMWLAGRPAAPDATPPALRLPAAEGD
jgi:signal transduction histidine kinase